MIVTARLKHFAVVTFAADPHALTALLPAGMDIDLPLVSAVAYRYVGLGRAGWPWPRLSADQVHLRAYVRAGGRHGEPGVWFLRTVQDSAWAALPRALWAMPWQRGEVGITEAADGSLRVATDGIDLAFGAVSTPASVPASAPASARNPSIPAEVTDATLGWFQGRRRVQGFEVAFDDGAVQPVGVGGARVQPFEDLGLVTVGQAPEHAFRHADTRIRIKLPPR